MTPLLLFHFFSIPCLISCSSTEPYPSLRLVPGMNCHLNSETFSLPIPSMPITIRHHQPAPLSITPQAFHSKLESHLFKNSYPDSSDPPSSQSRPKQHPP